MAITNLTKLYVAPHQTIKYLKYSAGTETVGQIYSYFAVGAPSDPPNGSSTIGNIFNGIVPSNGMLGYPVINSFSGTLYINKISGNYGLASTTVFNHTRAKIYDRVFAAGAYASNSTVTLSSVPSFSSRLPNSDYKGLELWVETVAVIDATSVKITYINENGVTNSSTITTYGTAIGTWIQVPLASGDNGISSITAVTAISGSTGRFNVNILRPLSFLTFSFVGKLQNYEEDFIKTGFPIIYSTSALIVLRSVEVSSTTSVLELQIGLVSG